MKIIQKRKGGIGLDCVVRFNPGQILVPVVKLSLCLMGIVEKTAGLHVVIAYDVFDLFGLTVGEKPFVIALEEIKRRVLFILEKELIAL